MIRWEIRCSSASQGSSAPGSRPQSASTRRSYSRTFSAVRQTPRRLLGQWVQISSVPSTRRTVEWAWRDRLSSARCAVNRPL